MTRRDRNILGATFALMVCFSSGSQAQSTNWKAVAPGVVRRELESVDGSLVNRRVWLYKPTVVPPNRKLRTVLIAAAGSRMFNGVPLGSGDMPEHIPYAKAGFAVVAYETDGTLSGESTAEIGAAARSFAAAQGGVTNAKAALDAAFVYAPFVDRKHVYAVGHSSAATLALAVAASDTRIAGCVAYAPQPDIPDYLDGNLAALNRQVPGFVRVIYAVSPQQNADKLRRPLFLFHAKDDRVVSRMSTFAYIGALRRARVAFTFKEVPTGDHYESMIRAGIPAGIAWMKKQP